MIEYIPLIMFAVICLTLMAGFPVAFTLSGTALIFAGVGILTNTFDPAFLEAAPNRIFGTISNTTLIAVPLFVLMGIILERSRVAEELLHNMAATFGQRRAGMGISVIIVGTLLAASTGIVGATVVTMGLMSLPSMLKQGYSPSLATGTICATGTLGQIIPPSIALVLLGDILSSAYQKAQLDMGIFSPQSVSVGDLFVGSLVPGLMLVALYVAYLLLHAFIKPGSAPAIAPEILGETSVQEKIASIVPPIALIVLVLGSILGGIATPTEAAGVGAFGAMLLALFKGAVNTEMLRDVGRSTLEVTCMVFMILIGAAIFSLVFRGFGGEELIQHFFEQLPGGLFAAMLVVMLVIFFLGFILDFIEITFVVVPIVAPILFTMGVDPIWLGVMIAINLQTSFLTPPFGFALFYLRGVTDESVKTSTIYRGVIPFIAIQLLMLALLAVWPEIATWLPAKVYA